MPLAEAVMVTHPLRMGATKVLSTISPAVAASVTRAAMGRKALERFETQFTGRVFARNTEEIYRNILKGVK